MVLWLDTHTFVWVNTFGIYSMSRTIGKQELRNLVCFQMYQCVDYLLKKQGDLYATSG